MLIILFISGAADTQISVGRYSIRCRFNPAAAALLQQVLRSLAKISMASFTCSSGIQWVINASGRIRPFSIQSMTSGKRPLFSREEKIEISLLVMLCWSEGRGLAGETEYTDAGGGGGEENGFLQDRRVAGGINDQRGGKLPLRQLFRERLVSVIERQIGAVFPGPSADVRQCDPRRSPA